MNLFRTGNSNCDNGCGCSLLWIILLLSVLGCGCDNGTSLFNNGDNGCGCDIITLLILLALLGNCCGNNDNNCGCNSCNNNSCGCGC